MTKEKKNLFFIIILGVLGLIFFFVSVAKGAVDISVPAIISALVKGEDTVDFRIIYHIRLPRTLAAILVGAALALSGVILQGVMRNPLATPNIIGVSSGAGLTALTILILYPQYFYLVPVGAFVGALLTTLIIYSLAWKQGIVPTRLILAGVAVNTILRAGNDILISAFPDRIQTTVDFMVGGLSGTSWQDIRMITPYILIGIIASLFFTQKMNVLMLGDEVATGLGLNVEMVRRILIVISSVLAGAAVSAVGLLGFVGLIVPHLARSFVGNDNRYLVPASILLGSLTLMVCDLIARTILAPIEIPVGVIMSIIGGPFFLVLLRKQYRLK